MVAGRMGGDENSKSKRQNGEEQSAVSNQPSVISGQLLAEN